MTPPLLPNLTVHQHGTMRAEWVRHIEAGLPIPSVVEPIMAYEVEHLEHDYMRMMLGAPGAEVERRLGKREQPNYASFTPSAGRANAQSIEFERGLRAILRLLATGKQSGAEDLQELIDGGPSNAMFTDAFDGAVKDLMLIQQRMATPWRQRVAARTVEVYEPQLPGFDLGR